MQSNCEVYIGNDNKVLITNKSIIAFAAQESMHDLPSGRLILRAPNKAIEEILKMPSNIDIEIILSAADSSYSKSVKDENKKSIKGNIVKHYSKTSGSNSCEYVIEFINAGEKLSYLSLIKGQAISNTSIGTIQKLSKMIGATLNLNSADIATNDYMKWLIVNKNFILSLKAILNHSYISDKDALYLTYNLDGTIRLGSILNSYGSDSKILYLYQRNSIDKLNYLVDMGSYKQLTYYANNVINAGGVITATTQTGVSTYKTPIKGKATGPQSAAVTSDSPTGQNEISGTLKSPITKTDLIVKKNPNVHDYYGIAPKVRDSVYGRFTNKIEIYASGESAVKVGDVINVIVPTVGSQFAKDYELSYSVALSGKYLVTAKEYYFGNGDRFEVKMTLIKDSTNSTNNDFLTTFGIDKDMIK